MTDSKCIRAATLFVEAEVKEDESGDAEADNLLLDLNATEEDKTDETDSDEELVLHVKSKEEREAEAEAAEEDEYKIEAVVDLHNFFSTFNRKKVSW